MVVTSILSDTMQSYPFVVGGSLMIALGTLTCCFGSDTYDLGGCLAVSFFQEILFVTEVMIIIHGNM